jgi:hypothetical protein
MLDEEGFDLVGSGTTSATLGGSSASRKRKAIPSSDQMTSTSVPNRSRSVWVTAIAHGACTRAPSGESTTTLQSPISSRKRSTTIVLVGREIAGGLPLFAEVRHQVVGRPGVEAVLRLQRGQGSVGVQTPEPADELSDGPSGLERPARRVPVPEGHLGRWFAGAGMTSTLSGPMSLILQVDAPRTNTSPTRDS